MKAITLKNKKFLHHVAGKFLIQLHNLIQFIIHYKLGFHIFTFYLHGLEVEKWLYCKLHY